MIHLKIVCQLGQAIVGIFMRTKKLLTTNGFCRLLYERVKIWRNDRIFILNIAIHWIFPPADVIITSQTKTTKTVLLNQKRFYNRETIPSIRISPLALSWLAENGKRVWKTFAVFYNSARQLIMYYDNSIVK